MLASQFYQEKESFWHMASNILNKPKPKVSAVSEEILSDVKNQNPIIHRGNQALKVMLNWRR